MTYVLLLAIGLVAGVFGGLFGIGGGLVMVPALVLLMKLKQLEAFGTSLAAMVPPVGLLAAFEYYRNGYINVRFAAVLAVGLLLGAYLGARIAIDLPVAAIRKAYAVFLIAVAARMLLMGK